MDIGEIQSENTTEDSKQEGPIESPFKLIKVKGNNALPLLGVNPANTLPSPTSKSPSSDTASSSLSPTSPTAQALSSISLNPFSLSKLKKTTTTAVNGTTMSRISPLSGIGKDLTPEQHIAELQDEVASLKKEIESKDAKLSSSMRSIKMFWSPELKKERSAHKEDVERMLLLKSQFDNLQVELKKYRNGENSCEHGQTIVQELNEEKSSGLLKNEVERLQTVNEELKMGLLKYEKESKDLKSQGISKDEELVLRMNTIEDLKIEMKILKAKEQDNLLAQNNVMLVEEKLAKLNTKLKEKDEEIEHLTKRMKLLEQGKGDFDEIIKRKESLIKDLQEKEEQFRKENKALNGNYQEIEAKCKVLEKELKEKKEENYCYKDQTKKLQVDFETSIEECKSLQKTLEDTRTKILELCEDLEKTKEQVENKEDELSSLKEEVEKMKVTVEEKEEIIKEHEESLVNLKVMRRRESVEVQDLRSVADGRSKELESLTKKYDALEGYLSHRETALSHARDELNDVKSKHANCTTTIKFMENQIADKDQLISRLEKQRNRLEKEKEEETSNLSNNKEQNEAKVTSLATQVEEKEALVKELEEKIEKLQDDLDKSRCQIEERKEALVEKEDKIDTLTKNLAATNDTIKILEKSLNEKKNKEENDKNSLKVVEDPQKRFSGNSPVKDSKMIKQLWDEIAKKDSKLQDLEKQLKDRGKQLNSLRKTQNLEKQTQFLTDKTKKDGDSSEQLVEFKEELTKRDERIAMLEDALRESVSIAAEREELLAQHVEFSEEAAKSMRELETDTDKLTMEKGITNIKNAFLILSLAERDTLLASLKAMRKRNMEELMNIRQTALLAAISEKDSNIALLELQSSSKSRKQEIKQCKQEKDKLVNELKEQTQQRITITNNEDNKGGFLFKELEDSSNEMILQAMRSLTDSCDKLEYYIDALISFVKEKNLEILKEMPTLQKRSQKSLDKLRNASKSQLLRELQRCEEDCSQLKSFVDILLEKLEG